MRSPNVRLLHDGSPRPAGVPFVVRSARAPHGRGSLFGLGEVVAGPSPFVNTNPQPFTLYHWTIMQSQGRMAVEALTGTAWPSAASFLILTVQNTDAAKRISRQSVESLWNFHVARLDARAKVPPRTMPAETYHSSAVPEVVTLSKENASIKDTGFRFMLAGAQDLPNGAWLWWRPGMDAWAVSGGGTVPFESVAPAPLPPPPAPTEQQIAERGLQELRIAFRRVATVAKIYRDELATLLETTVRTEIVSPAMLLRTDTGVMRMMAYEGDCTPENLARIGVRHDLYLRAQIALADLTKPENYPGSWNWWATWSDASTEPVFARKAQETRAEMARVACDWLSIVHSWVSIALFAGNIQPAMLFPKSTTKVGTGEYMPGKKAVPPKVESALNVIAGVGGDLATEHILSKENYGPLWMGFYDTEEATGWLSGNFAPQPDRSERRLNNDERVRGLDYVFPSNWKLRAPSWIFEDPEHQGMNMANKAAEDPWFLWYYNILASEACENTVQLWKKQYRGQGDVSDSVYVVGPRGSFELARAWGETIVESTAFDVFGDSFEWYGNNHIEYWKNLGVLEYSVSEISNAQRTVAAAKVDAKGAIASNAISQVAGAVMTVPNPIVQGVAAGCAILGSILTMSICKRRKRKKAAEAKKPQPLTLRTMTSVECATFSGATNLESQMAEAARQILDGDQIAAQIPAPMTANLPPNVAISAPVTVEAPLGTSTTPPVNIVPGATVAPPMPTPDAVAAIADANTNVAVPTPVSIAGSPSVPSWVWIGGGLAVGLTLLSSLAKR